MHFRQEKMEDCYEKEQSPYDGLSDSSMSYSVVNENWKSKNDATERRRIQNRLNQRAFRQRQRAGESPKPYRPRSTSGGTPHRDKPSSQSGGEQDERDMHEGRSTSMPSLSQTEMDVTSATELYWDELGQLINKNFMQAARENGRSIGIDAGHLQDANLVRTREVFPGHAPAALQPIRLQYEIGHDPIFDIIPHARLRYNILHAISMQQIDAAALSRCLRASGALFNKSGQWQRAGLVVWNAPDQIASWELSEMFVRQWAVLLQGCEDLLVATNTWRSRRGERLFSLSLASDLSSTSTSSDAFALDW